MTYWPNLNPEVKYKISFESRIKKGILTTFILPKKGYIHLHGQLHRYRKDKLHYRQQFLKFRIDDSQKKYID